MPEQALLQAVARLAFLNAIILTFLTVQVVFPPAVILLLCLLPSLFALQAYRAPGRLAALSAGIVIGLAFLLFGLEIGVWAVVYLGGGMALGRARRGRLPVLARLGIGMILFGGLMAAVLFCFAWLAGVGWAEIEREMAPLADLLPLPLLGGLGVGLAGYSFLVALSAEHLTGRLLCHLEAADL